jgi:pimeloyl-ACP methyl ester carboxylesterase
MHNWNLTNAFAIIHTMPNSYPFTNWPSLAPFAKTLPTPNGNLFYYDTGVSDKQTVILLHGLGDEADTWRHVFPALTGAGYRVIAPDLPGFGRSVWKGGINVRGHCKAVIQLIKGINTAGQSPAPAAIEPGFAGGFPQQSANQRFGGVLNPSVPHSLDHARASAVAASLHSLINATGAASAERPAVVAGSSLGAGIAEMVADRRPGFVQKLILIDSCLPFAVVPSHFYQRLFYSGAYRFFNGFDKGIVHVIEIFRNRRRNIVPYVLFRFEQFENFYFQGFSQLCQGLGGNPFFACFYVT